jgi:hypothetical protein
MGRLTKLVEWFARPAYPSPTGRATGAKPAARRRSTAYEEARKIPARNRAIAAAQAEAASRKVEVQLPGGGRAWMSAEELARYEALRGDQRREGI